MLENIDIKNLSEIGDLSVRAFNVCMNLGLYTLEDVLNYYEKNKTFIRIRNSGRKTDIELIKLCKNSSKYIDNYYIPIITKPIKNEVEVERIIDIKQVFDSLSGLQIRLLELYYLGHKSNLDKRAENAISKFSFIDFFEQVICVKNYSFHTLAYIGRKTIDFLIHFKHFIENEVYRIASLTEGEVVVEFSILKYGIVSSGEFITSYYERNRHFPMFWILQNIIEQKSDRSISILVNSFKVFQDHKIKSLDEIASELSITRERVRQIRIDSVEMYFSTNSIFFEEIEDWNNYSSLICNDVISNNSPSIKNIIQQEQTNLSPFFIIQVFSVICNNNMNILGGYEITRSTEHEWRSSFLINHQLYEIFDFNLFRKFILDIVSYPRSDNYIFDVDNYLRFSCLFWKSPNLDRIDSIKNIIYEILINEFQLYADVSGIVIIGATIEKHPSEIVYEILKQNKSPMKLVDIFIEFKKRMPDHKYVQAEQIRPSIASNKYITFINRSSTYTLIEWKHIKTGTIRDAIVEFLKSQDSPQKDSDIANYVLAFFPASNISSIRTSIYNDTKSRFSFYKCGLIGLQTKKYPSNYEEINIINKQKKSFEERLFDFETFLTQNLHFPFISSSDSTEVSLGRWWYLILSGKKFLTEAQALEVERIKNQYPEYESNEVKFIWNVYYNKMRCFLLENRRLPFQSGPEKFLHVWLKKIKSDYMENNLSEDQRKKYIELCKLL